MEPFFIRKHPVDGEFSLTLEGDCIRLRCRLPIDTSTDEWIDVSDTFRLSEYLEVLSNLRVDEPRTISGLDGSDMKVTLTDSGRVWIYILDTGTARGQAYHSDFDAMPSDLVPGSSSSG